MLFTSIEFYFFVIAVFAIWLAIPAWRLAILLGASYLFYALWQPWFLVILIFCTVVSWIAGQWMAASTGKRKRQKILLAAVGLNLAPLLFFKYFNFISGSFNSSFSYFGLNFPIPYLALLLPLGISFYTFQAISYCTDVYNQKFEAETNAVDFALYMAFFPKLISGPIERGASLLPQLKRNSVFNGPLFISGIQLFLWGLFKKVVIADRLSMYVDMVFSNPQGIYGKTAIIGAWMFSLQIYCDFSAYMDMAIGCGRIFGIELSRNFHFPYMARTIGEFWRRWHITLTSWFRDYVYIPLGGNRVKTMRWAANILVVFLLSGLWHGAGWTFIVWGALHGLFYLVGKYSASFRSRFRMVFGIRGGFEAFLQVILTFNLVSIAWVFFRVDSIEDAVILIRNMFINLDLPVRMLSSQFSTALSFLFAFVFVGLELIHFWADRRGINMIAVIPPLIRYPAYASGLLTITLLGVSSNQFIYFQF